MTQSLLRLSLVALFALVSACSKVTITAPSEGVYPDDPPDTFSVKVEAGVDGTPSPKMSLNGNDVTDLFVTAGSTLSATGADLLPYIIPGNNLFRVTSPGGVSPVTFYYDIEGPNVHILTVEEGSNIEVTGYLDDPGGAASLIINGNSIPLDGNDFSASIAYDSIIDFEATDNYGHTTTRSFARRDVEFTPSISTRINANGMNFLLEQITTGIGDANFGEFMRAQNPIFEANFIGFFTIEVDAEEFAFSSPVVEMDILDNEQFDMHVEIPNLAVGANLHGRTAFFIPWAVGGTVTADNVIFDTVAGFSIDQADIDISLSDTSMVMEGFYLDLNFLPNILGFESLLSNIVSGLLGVIMPILIDVIEQAIVPLLSDFIKDVPIEADIVNAVGETVHVKALPWSFDTSNGGMTIGLGGGITAPNAPAEPGVALGSQYSPGTTPAFGETTQSGLPFDIGAMISANLLNQAFLAAHDSGLTTMHLAFDDNQGVSLDGVKLFVEEGDDIQLEDTLRVNVLPASPFSLEMQSTSATTGIFRIYDLSFAMSMKRPSWSNWRELFSATVNIEVPFEMGVDDDNFLQMGVETLPIIEVKAFDNWGAIQLSDGFINNAIEYFLPVFMPRLADSMEGVPLPTIGGFGILPQEIWVAGEGNNNLAFAGNLIKVETTENATEPDTNAELGVSSSALTGVDIVNGDVTIYVSGTNPTLQPLQYRYRLDGGPWSIWKEREQIQLQRLLGGNHVVEVCSRTVELKEDSECAVVEFETMLASEAASQ